MAIRGTNGRFVREPRDGPDPFEDVRRHRERDGRSGRKQEQTPSQLTLRIPIDVMLALRREALQRDVTVTKLVLEALADRGYGELQSALHGNYRLRDPVESTLKTLPGNVKLNRIEDVVRSDVRDPIPKHDHIAQQRRRAGSKPPPSLMDRRR